MSQLKSQRAARAPLAMAGSVSGPAPGCGEEPRVQGHAGSHRSPIHAGRERTRVVSGCFTSTEWWISLNSNSSDTRIPKPRELVQRGERDSQVVEFGAVGPFPGLTLFPPEADPVVPDTLMAQQERLKESRGTAGISPSSGASPTPPGLCAAENPRRIFIECQGWKGPQEIF